MSYGHPEDTRAALRRLCAAHFNLHEIYMEVEQNGSHMIGPIAGSPVKGAIQGLVDLMEPMLNSLPDEMRLELLPDILKTHAPALIALLPKPGPDYCFIREKGDMQVLIAKGPEAFALELSYGLAPPTADFDFLFNYLLAHLDQTQPSYDLWLENLRLYFLRQTSLIIQVILSLARRRESWRPELSVFLSEILIQHVEMNPVDAEEICLSAAVGACTADVAALILAGAKPPAPDRESIQNAPKVRALLQKCASHHGRLELHFKFGPLPRYFDLGNIPDFR